MLSAKLCVLDYRPSWELGLDGDLDNDADDDMHDDDHGDANGIRDPGLDYSVTGLY